MANSILAALVPFVPAASIDILPTTPEEEQVPLLPPTKEGEANTTAAADGKPADANATAAPAPTKSSAAGSSYSLAITVFAAVLGAAIAL